MNKRMFFLLFGSIVQPVFASYMCDDLTTYYAVYNPNSYTCSNGEFLPSNSVTCSACQNGFVCPGGVFNFNENEFQGVSINAVPGTTITNMCAQNFPQNLSAVYELNSHDCSAGYYLPANADACTACPAGYTCAGGTYTFNETTDQGITANTITINWGDGNGGTHATTTCSYGGDITTPTTAPTAPRGYHFIGWVFD